ncbi:MAG: YcjX family protein [Fimbriiglobus sp.]
MAGTIWRTAERHIGILGLYNSGKTVLLTSLADHLLNHDPSRFRLGELRDTVTLRRVRPEPVSEGWADFPYLGYRNALTQDGKWPRKTKDRAEFACRFERSDWRFNEALVRFYDLPGERLADAAMFGKTYAEWADHWHQYTQQDRIQQEVFAPFLKLLQTPGSTEIELVDSYRHSLARSIAAPYFKPFVSPSTFYLDPQGTLPHGTTPEEIAVGRFVGLSTDSQFVPLNRTLREANSELTRRFHSHYDHYQTAIIEPTIAALARCHSLIVLVDVLELLQSGVGMANDNRQMLRDLFSAIDPGEGTIGRMQRWLSEALLFHRPRWVNKIAFVAPKADLVHPTDRDRLLYLLQKFVGNLALDYEGLQQRHFVTSSIISTSPLPLSHEERFLVGVPYRDAEGQRIPRGEAQKMRTPQLPSDWPPNWNPGDWNFPQVYPQMPNFRAVAPDQLGLDQVLDWVMD